MPYTGPYVASKHAVVGMMRTAAVENGRHGVRVNAVLPGFIDTRMLRTIIGTKLGGLTPADEAIAGIGAGATALGRTATPEDVARAVVYLLSDEAGYVTGTAMPVDGGALAMGPGRPGSPL